MMRLVLLIGVFAGGCGPSDQCGMERMLDPTGERCICRPEYTAVDRECIPNDQIDAGFDAADASSDTSADVASDVPQDASPDSSLLPDLTISCPDPDDIVGAGDRVDLTANIANTGGDLLTEFDVTLELFDTLSDEWVIVGTARFVGALRSGAATELPLSGRAPDVVLGGMNMMRCRVDSEAAIAEGDEVNNDDPAVLFATGLPDLEVAGGAVPSPFSRTVTGSINVRNIGRTAAPDGVWSFSMFIPGVGGDTVGRGDLPFLVPGESTTEVKEGGWCVQVSGVGQVTLKAFIETDADTSNDNNVRDDISFVGDCS